VINDDVEACYRRVSAILSAERLRRDRQGGLIDFVRALNNG
jgi:guanylate kinase